MTYPKDMLRSFGNVERATCFVMMPFARQFDSIYNRIKETLQAPPLNMVCSRADDIRRPNIIDTILRAIAQSEYALADLTGLNANVFYELGIAHCFKDADKVVLLTQDVGELPFDLRQLRCIQYGHSAAGMKALKAELIKTFQSASADTFRFRLKEGERFTLETRLTGRSRNLFELSFECAFAGRDGLKVVVSYARRSLVAASTGVNPQYLYIERGQSEQLEHVPWRLHLVECGGDGALLVLERCGDAPK